MAAHRRATMDDAGSAAWRHADLMHALRTPLTVIMGRVQIMRRDVRRGQPSAHLSEHLEAIEAALIRLAVAVERVDEREPPA